MNLRNVAIFISLLCAIFILLTGLFIGKAYVDGDLYDEYVPVKYFQRESLYNGQLPVTSKGIGMGFPIYRDIQSGMYYPPNAVFMLPFDIYKLTNYSIILNLLLLGIGAYMLSGRFFTERYKSVLFMFITVLNGFTISHIGHLSILCVMAAMPFYFYFRMGKKSSLMLNSVFLFIVLSGGHPQMFMYTIITSFAYALYRRDLRRELKLYFATAGLSAVIILPLLILSLHNPRPEMDLYNVMPLKGIITAVFPSIHYAFSSFFPVKYTGPYYYNEISFYQSLLIIFAIPALYKAVKSNLKVHWPILLIAVSFIAGFTPLGGLMLFKTPVRISGYASIVFSLYALKYFEMPTKKQLILIMNMILISGIILIMRQYCIYAVINTYVITLFYAAVFILISKFKLQYVKYILIAVTAFDLILYSRGMIETAPLEAMRHTEMPELKNESVITFVPDEIFFYEEFLKQKFNVPRLEMLLANTTYGNRGVYQHSYSFNIYNTLTYREYIEYFKDPSLLSAGFSRINILQDMGNVNWDYIFVPDAPAIFNLHNETFIINMTSINDTIFVFCDSTVSGSGRLIDMRDDFLINVNYSTIALIPGRVNILHGRGIVYMMKTSSGRMVSFPDVMKLNGFKHMRSGPFFLFKKSESGGSKFRFHPDKAVFVPESRYSFFPWDLAAGASISFLTLLALIIFSIRRRKCEN